MNVLILLSHPSSQSFTSTLAKHAAAQAEACGHKVRLIDLYATGFDPVMREAEWQGYGEPTEDPILLAQIEALKWAEALILVTPIWWSGPNAMMKGWMDRVWRPGVSFVAREDGSLRPGLSNIRALHVITTLGMPRLLWWLAGQAGRRMFLRGLRPCLNPRARSHWHALYKMDATTPAQRQAFMDRIARAMRRL